MCRPCQLAYLSTDRVMNIIHCHHFIGFHQKCHVPNIPASALELDTPWNCVYCLKGVKCPYLTESLDVLQNLLSDDEEASVQDTTKNVHIAKVDTDFEPDSFNQQDSQTPPKKKRVKLMIVTTSCYEKISWLIFDPALEILPTWNIQNCMCTTLIHKSKINFSISKGRGDLA